MMFCPSKQPHIETHFHNVIRKVLQGSLGYGEPITITVTEWNPKCQI